MAKPVSTVTGQITAIDRLNNSVNGNPRYDVFFRTDESSDWYTTSSDAACSYDIENVYNRQDCITLGLTRAGRISTITRVSE